MFSFIGLAILNALSCSISAGCQASNAMIRSIFSYDLCCLQAWLQHALTAVIFAAFPGASNTEFWPFWKKCWSGVS